MKEQIAERYAGWTTPVGMDSRAEFVATWLYEFLQNGERRVDEVFADGNEQGYSEAEIWEAFAELHCVSWSKKLLVGERVDYWRLPRETTGGERAIAGIVHRNRDGITVTELTADTRWMQSPERELAIKRLAERGVITIETVKPSKIDRPARVLRPVLSGEPTKEADGALVTVGGDTT